MLGKVQKAQVDLAVAKAVVEDTIEPEVEKHTSHLAAAKAAILEDLKKGLGKESITRSKIATKEDSNREKDPKGGFHLTTMIKGWLIFADLSYLRCQAILF